MSFSGDIKDELARQIPSKDRCLRAEIAGIIRLAGTVRGEAGAQSVLIETENVSLAKKYLRLVKKAYGIQVDLQIRKHSAGKSRQYTILIGDAKEAERVIAGTYPAVQRERLLRFLPDPESRRAFIRGAFLASGSMSDPAKSYHLEIVCRTADLAEELREIIQTFDIPAKTVGRKARYVVYVKDSEGIVDMLNVMEAHSALMELENVRIIKDMRNSANRQYNCDAANISKMVRAAARQLEDIRYIERHGGFEDLSAPLREMALVRLEHPDVSLQEAGSYLDPPVGKSGVNHRLRKLSEIARELRAKQEE